MAVPTLSLALPARRCAHGDTHRRADEVVDPPAAIDWYIKYLGATKAAPPFGVAFGRTQIAVVRTDTRQPSEGSVIDHIGLSFPDVRARITELAAGGARVATPLTDAPGLFAYAYVEDPWGVKIEIVQDSELLGFHHVHLRVADPAATLQWFNDRPGGAERDARDSESGD